jgi:ribosomal protein S27AE
MKQTDIDKLTVLVDEMDSLEVLIERMTDKITKANVDLEAIFRDATTCPRCLGGIPNDASRGKYPGALSRTDNKTYICSNCGTLEAIEQGHPRASKMGYNNLMPQEEWKCNTSQKRQSSGV